MRTYIHIRLECIINIISVKFELAYPIGKTQIFTYIIGVKSKHMFLKSITNNNDYSNFKFIDATYTHMQCAIIIIHKDEVYYIMLQWLRYLRAGIIICRTANIRTT